MRISLEEWTDEDIDQFIISNGQDPKVMREPFKIYFQALMATDEHIDALVLASKLYIEQAEKAKEGNV